MIMTSFRRWSMKLKRMENGINSTTSFQNLVVQPRSKCFTTPNLTLAWQICSKLTRREIIMITVTVSRDQPRLSTRREEGKYRLQFRPSIVNSLESTTIWFQTMVKGTVARRRPYKALLRKMKERI